MKSQPPKSQKSSKDRPVLQLLDKSRRSLLRGVFSRTTVIAVLLILQILFIVSSYMWLDRYNLQLRGLEILLIVGTVLYLINSDMDATAIITWLILLIPFPIVGSLFLAYTKLDWGYRAMKSHYLGVVAESSSLLKQDEGALLELKNRHTSNYNLVSYLQKTSGSYPVYRQTDVSYFSSGEDMFHAMKEQLLAAKRYIFLEYFIIDEGLMWGEILAILEQKVKDGVEVRVIYDGMIEFSTLSFDYTKRLEKLGIQARAFAPISPFISTYYNYRDHRKLMIIDGEVGFTGGVNLADEYINQIERFGHWKDTGIMLKGKAVDTLTVLFLQMWARPGERIEAKSYLPIHKPGLDNGYIIPYADSPLDGDKVGENVYIDILNHARDYVHIMTPYLILDGEMVHALKFAAERGVDVKVMMPGIPDKSVPFALAKTYYKTLMTSGVEIYEYTPGFLHAKSFVADNQKAVVGTINLDYRSLYHHFENAVYMYQTSAIKDIEEDFQETLKKSKLVTLDEVNGRSPQEKMVGILAKAVSPLL